MSDKQIKVLGIRPVHRRGESSYIELSVVLAYLKDEPVASVTLSVDDALRLIEQAAKAVLVAR